MVSPKNGFETPGQVKWDQIKKYLSILNKLVTVPVFLRRTSVAAFCSHSEALKSMESVRNLELSDLRNALFFCVEGIFGEQNSNSTSLEGSMIPKCHYSQLHMIKGDVIFPKTLDWMLTTDSTLNKLRVITEGRKPG